MTKEEAILVLDNARPQTKEIDRQFYDDEDLNNALDMAIKALEQQTINCDTTTEEIAQSFKADIEAVKDYLPECNSMEFPKDFYEFVNDYGFIDDKQIYTNGSHLIPVFRVEQWLNHIEKQDKIIKALEQQPYEDEVQKVVDYLLTPKSKSTSEDSVSRAEVIEAMTEWYSDALENGATEKDPIDVLNSLPPITPTFPKGTTNGDVIMAMFPNVEVVRQEISSTSNNMVVRDDSFFGAINRFHTDWWNAPYKRGNSDGSN